MHKLLDIIHKPPLLMVRTVLIAVMTLFVTLSSHAQEGLAVNSIFQQYGHSKGCKMVVMQNTKLRGYRLAVYKSLTYNNKYATSITMATATAATADDIQMRGRRKAISNVLRLCRKASAGTTVSASSDPLVSRSSSTKLSKALSGRHSSGMSSPASRNHVRSVVSSSLVVSPDI